MNEEFVTQIKSLLGERFSTVKVVRENYSKGEDVFDPILPLGVVFPKTTEEVSKILKL